MDIVMDHEEMLERVHAILMDDQGVHSLTASLEEVLSRETAAFNLVLNPANADFATSAVAEFNAELSNLIPVVGEQKREPEGLLSTKEPTTQVQSSHRVPPSSPNLKLLQSSEEDEIVDRSAEKPSKTLFRFYFGCSMCPKSFYDRISLLKHRHSMHGTTKACKDCMRRVQNSEKEPRGFVCQVCGKAFAYRSRLRVHLAKHTNDHSLFRCAVCGKGFVTKSYLEIHMRMHSGEKPFSCEVCGKSFTQRAYLNAHMAVHTKEKFHVCKLCGKEFTFKCALVAHMNSSVHNAVRPVVCPICSKDFATKNSLKQHVLKRHSDLSPESVDDVMKKSQLLSSQS